jgi:hypothetical protein
VVLSELRLPPRRVRGDLETWCQRIAQDGWQLWDAGMSAIIDHDGQMVRRISLRRRADLREDLERHTTRGAVALEETRSWSRRR